MEVFLINSREQNKQDKQSKFLRQPEPGKKIHLSNFLNQPIALSGEIVPFEYFLQTICRLITEFVQLDGFSQARCPGMLIHLFKFLRQSVTI